MRHSKRAALALAVAATLGIGRPTLAATGQWITDGSGNWNTGGNWLGGTIPNATDDVADLASINLTLDSTVTLDVAVTLGQLTFGDADTSSAAGWVLAGPNALTLSSSGAATITVNGLGAGRVATISAAVTSSQTVSKSGTGTLVLTGTNIWSTGTTINAGVLQIGAGGTVGTLGTGAITNNGTLAINRSDAVSIADNISGSGNLTKAGAGILTVSGTNTYSGTTTINAGAITFNSASIGSLGTGTVTVNAAGSVQYGATTLTDSNFINKISSASTGTLAIPGADAGTNFDFTTGAFAALGNMSLGVLAPDIITYTATVTPAGSTYRLGGGGGTLNYVNALTGAGNSLVVGPAANNGGTVVLLSNSTYGGTTTINAGSILQIGSGSTTGTLGAGNVIGGNGTLTFNRSGGFAVTNNIAVNQLNVTGSATSTGIITASGTFNINPVATNRWTVSGGSLTATGLGTVGNAGQFYLTSGTASFAGGIRVGTSNDSSFINISNGTFNASTLTIARSSNFGVGAAPTAGSTTAGVYIANGTLNVSGNVIIATSNSSASIRQDNSTATTIGGNLIIGAQTGTNRWSVYDMNGGTLNVTGPLGIVAASDTATDHGELGEFLMRAGTTTTSGISFGDVPTLISGQGLFQMNGGTLYLGTGGMTKRGAGTFTATANLSGGVLAAGADSTSSANIVLPTANFTIQAADSGGTAHNMTFTGTISGGPTSTGSIVKTGGGILDLQGTNNWLGTGTFATVNAGTLAGKAGSLLKNITNNAAVLFNEPTGTTTYIGVISGTGSVSKTGPGTSLVGSGQTYTGATAVSQGLLGLSGTLASSGVTVNNGGGLLTRSGGASVSALTLGSTGTDAMTIAANDGAGLSTLTVTSNNGLTTNGTTTIEVGVSGITVGTKVLVDYSGSILGSGFAGFTLGALPPRMIASLQNNVGNTSVDLNVSGFDNPRWIGNVSGGVWDINTTANWKTVTGNATTTYLQASVPGDQVLFDDAATGTTTVNVSTTLSPAIVTVNNNNLNYTFTGSGKISGATPLNKLGTGSLTVSNTGGNDYSGGTTISAGTLVLGVGNALPAAGNLFIAGGTLDMGTLNPVFSGGVTLNGGTLTNGTINKTSGNYDLQSGTVTDTAVISGTAGIVKSGTGTVVILGSTHNYTGTSTVNGGTLQFGNGVAANGAVPGIITNNATIDFNPNGQQIWTNNIQGVAGNIIKDGPGELVIPNTVIIDGIVVINGGQVTVIGPGGTSVVPRLGRGGSITVNSGATLLTQGGNALGLGTGNLPPTWLLNAGGTIRGDSGSDTTLYNGTFAGGIVTADGAYASFTFRGDYTVAASTTSTVTVPGNLALFNAVQFSLGSNSVLSISSNLTNDTSTMVASGAGTLILSGNNTALTAEMFTSNGATIQIGDTTNLSGNATFGFNNGTLRTTASINDAHNMTLATTPGGTVDTNGFDSTFSGAMTGTGNLTKTGAGLLLMTSSGNAWTGNATIAAGTLQIPFGASMGTGNVTNNATLKVEAPATVLNVDGTGSMTVGDGTNAVSVSANHYIQGSLTVAAGSTASVNSSGGTATGVSKVGSLTIGANAKLNLTDNKLITATAAGTWNGANYTGVTGLVASGKGTSNLWTGATGIVTTQTTAINSNYHTIGVAKASDVRPNTATETALWAGQTITGTDTLVMFTYGGDANLDGKLNIDDYVRIDQGIAGGMTGWANGDFNYDGKINIDDYTTIIDSNIGNQSGAFFTSGGIDLGGGGGLSGVSAVPEPATVSIIGLAAIGALRRRRRRN